MGKTKEKKDISQELSTMPVGRLLLNLIKFPKTRPINWHSA